MANDDPAPAAASMRERKRAAARTHVAEAAAALFVTNGYTGTTTKVVAGAAGVAEGTVFNLFGSKSGLLLAALQTAVPDQPQVHEWMARGRGLEDARAIIDLFCRTGDEVAQAAIPLVRVFLEAAAVDRATAEAWRAQEARRLESQTWLLDVLAERGWLRRDRARDLLARDVWVLAAPEVLVKMLDAGVASEDFWRWLSGALGSMLLDPDG